MTKNEALQQLLLSTGHALLIDYGNKAGLLLMELRSKFAAMSPTQNRIPLVSPLATTMELRSLLSAHMICFTAESVFHFLYPALIQLPNTKEVLPSPAHFVARQAIKYFNICAADAAYINETEKSIECWERMNTVIESSMPTLDKIQGWYMDERQRAIKISLSLMFDQHAPLMKALLDTGDALLVYCSRYSTPEAELTVGMRERDLRAWLAHIDIDTRQLFDSMVRPLAFRPPYLGGNRLGLILMEIRRECTLRGVFPHQLPVLKINTQTILGSESPSENYVCLKPFNVLKEENFKAVWANPFLLYAKQKKDSKLWAQAHSTKLAPKLISIDEPRLCQIVDDLDSRLKVTTQDLDDYPVEDLRGIFIRLALRIRSRSSEMDSQLLQMSMLAKEISAMQSMRRTLEERRIQMEGGPEKREKQPIPALPIPLPRAPEAPAPVPLMSGCSPPRKWEERRKPNNHRRRSPSNEKPVRRRISPSRQKSPSPRLPRKAASPSRRAAASPPRKIAVSPARRAPSPARRVASPLYRKAATAAAAAPAAISPPPKQQPKPPKPPIDESELSEGEIVSD
ncbi:unnamed protein product [Gongylonema pulchrum]|uniref:Protein kinase domain-containing protein n=1 Tax=Gongylonema pulchrum TaxID=637853 RepID=A0A183DWZ4_9BILA|nr:unnamed protein product [Gongylonema pulchrum]